ncbi:hypothetical protein JW962_01495 [Candidatus Dojkabacteria bacterium]|nr:hypothetical protein [Candidatus Dojkabacteria bacterium]
MNKFLKTSTKLIAVGAFVVMLWVNLPLGFVFADDLYSDDPGSTYKIEGITVGTAGGVDQHSEGLEDYRVMIAIGDNLNSEKLSSSSYKLGFGSMYVWTANVPTIDCFETDTTGGTTTCTHTSVSSNGMLGVCGNGGCYDRAHFELNAQNNATDTLYAVQISTDVNWGSYMYVDGSTYTLKSPGSITVVNDFKTLNSWNSLLFNVVGLSYGETYYLRAVALDGNYTESAPGPAISATTGYPSIVFDIDIGTSSSVESSPPYLVDLGTIFYGSVVTSVDKIWIDLGTNMTDGVQVFVRDQNEGLYSSGTSSIILSLTTDLSNNSGYGLRSFSTDQGALGPIIPLSPYGGTGDNVGGLINDIYSRAIYSSSYEPLYNGRAGVEVKARIDETNTAASDYSDTLFFTIAGEL